MRIADAYKNGKPVFSFELMPPRNAQEFDVLHKTIAARRELTVQLVTDIKRDIGIEAMAHLTCSDNTAEQLAAILERLEAAGIENVIALRGDAARGKKTFIATEGGL